MRKTLTLLAAASAFAFVLHPLCFSNVVTPTGVSLRGIVRSEGLCRTPTGINLGTVGID